MDKMPIHLLLADDDKDDCLLFKEALDELGVPAELSVVSNGEQLMRLLEMCANEAPEGNTLPSIIFLDLNMPRKNGFECLTEIKRSGKLKDIPVIIFSTSYDKDVANLLYRQGAHHYIRKPSEFSKLKKVIREALTMILEKDTPLREGDNPGERDKFII